MFGPGFDSLQLHAHFCIKDCLSVTYGRQFFVFSPHLAHNFNGFWQLPTAT